MGVGAMRGRGKKCQLGRVHSNHRTAFTLLDEKKNAKDFVLIRVAMRCFMFGKIV